LALKHATVSMGFLFWVKMVLDHPTFARSNTYIDGVKAICHVVAQICRVHHMQHLHCFAILQLVIEMPHADNVSDTTLIELWKVSLFFSSACFFVLWTRPKNSRSCTWTTFCFVQKTYRVHY